MARWSEHEFYYCMLCLNDRRFDNVEKFIEHRYTVHADELYSCPKCQLLFPTTSQLIIHAKMHPTMYEYTCDFCGLAFLDKEFWDIHKSVRKCHIMGN